jgi:hypothetical protein
MVRPSAHEGAGGRAAARWLASRAAIQESATKKYLAAVAVFTVAAGSAGLAAPGALAVTHSAGSPSGTVAGASGHSGVRAWLAPPAAVSGPGWSIVPSPNPLARTGQLAGVSCFSSSSCTAVGDYTKRLGTTVTLAERWNGTSWSAESTPNPAGAPSSWLNAVDCTSAPACVAVGDAFTRSGTDITLAERWDGTRWSIQATPNPPAGGGVLFGVSCSSASACTAVGASNAGTFAERWNGTKWLIQPAPNPPSGGGVLFGVACTSAVSCTAVGFSNSGTLAEHWNGTTWAIQATPNPPQGGAGLSGVSCTSSSACTAVGGSNSGTLAEHWNGTTWAIQATPNPSGAQFTFLNGVACTSAASCSAVGGYGNSSGTLVTLAERWNGAKWAIQQTPSRADASFSFFDGVSCPSAARCVAAGPSANGFSTPVSLAESWNGNTWEIQNTPNLPGAEPSNLIGVSCPSPSNCMAVGGTGIDNSPRHALVAEHWNGNGWAIVPVPNPPGMTSAGGNLESVSCTGPSACMAVGAYANSSSQGQAFPVGQPLSERWNGTKWSVVPIPHLPGAQATFLNSISCTSGFACTAVAGVVSASGRLVTMAERWNGTRWSIQPTPNPAGRFGAVLLGVDCSGSSACTAVGAAVDKKGDPVGPTLAERWNGTRWSIQPTPNPSSPGGGTLNWVACPSPSACTAVGAAVDTSSNPLATLAERWNGTRWSIQPTPNPAGVQGPRLQGVACTSPSACTAVGGSFANASLAERWNGTKWVIQASPNPAGQIFDLILFTVACPRPLHCMAVGKYASFTPHFTATLAPQLTLAEQWNGSSENAQPAATVSQIPTALGLACLRVQRLIMTGLRAATSSAARFGSRRGPSTRPAWMAFLPQCRGT